MRTCLRCKNEMIENLEVMATNGSYGLDVREKGILKDSLGKIKCAVCSKCGYIETYLENTNKLNKRNYEK